MSFNKFAIKRTYGQNVGLASLAFGKNLWDGKVVLIMKSSVHHESSKGMK